MRNEDPPNKEVHAEDLAQALSRLHAWKKEPISPEEYEPAYTLSTNEEKRQADVGRARSGSVIVYHPNHHGDSPNLPAIAVEDLTDDPEGLSSIQEEVQQRPITHTSRPPVELMQQ